MALSYITREADGVQSQFDFPFGYLSKSHVFVFVDNSLVAFKWISDFLVEPLVRPLAGSSVTVRRLTDRANRVTTYTDGQTLLASSLNAGDLQTFFIAQEMIDQIEEGIVTGDVSVINPGTGYITAQWIQDQLQAGLAGAPQFAAVDQALAAEAAARVAAILVETNARVAAVNDLVADLSAEADARVADVAALTGAVAAETNARVAAVNAEASARAADVLSLTQADAAQVGRLTIVESDLNTPTTGLKAKIVTVENAVVTESSARATADSALQAELDNPTTGLKARATSLESRTTAVETGKANASALSSLEAVVNNPTTGLATRASQSALTSLSSTVDGKADASRVSALETSVNHPTTGLATRASQSALTSLSSTVDGKADASRVTALETSVNNPTTGLTSRALQTDFVALSSTVNGKADASRVTALETSVNNPTTGLSTRASQSDLTALSATVDGKASLSAFNTLQTAVNDPSTGLATRASQTSVTNLTNTVNNKADASRVTALEASVNNATTGLTSRALQTDFVALSSTVAGKADAARVTALETSVNHPTTGLSTRASQQSVTDLTTTVNGKASASALDALEAVVEDPTTGLTTKASQASLNALSATVDGKASLSALNSLSTQVNDPSTGLSTRASQQSVTDLTTVVNGKASASALSALEAVVQHPTTGLATRASQTDLSNLSVTVGQKADASTVSTLTASVNGTINDLAATWDDAAYFWDWAAGTIAGWSVANGTSSFTSDGGVTLTQSGANQDINFTSPVISYPGSRYGKMVVDVQCVNPGTPPVTQDGRGYWQTSGHGNSGSFSDSPRVPMPLVAGERKLIVYDFDTAEFGASDYNSSTITRVRFDLPQSAGGIWRIHSVKIVAPGTKGALSRLASAEASLTTANTAIADLTANKASASSVTTLTATVDTIKMDDTNTRPASRLGFLSPPTNGDPRTQANLTAGTVVASANEGQVLQVSGGLNFVHRNYIPIVPGRTYRVRARVRATADGTDQRINVGFRWTDASYTLQSLSSGFVDTTFTVAKGWRTLESTVTADAIRSINPTAAYLTSRLFIGFNAAGSSAGGQWEIAWSDIADITDLQNTAEIAAASSALNKNPFFAEGSAQSGVIPQGWSNWSNGTNCNIEARPWGGAGLHAFVPALAGSLQIGWQQNLGQGSIRAGNKYLVRADVSRGTGTYDASGVLLQWRNASDVVISSQFISFATERDTSGVLANAGDGRRVFEKTFTAPALATNVVFYAMTAWSGFGQAIQTTSPQLRWFECSLHQINSSTAGVTELREALATGTSAEARLLLAVNAATNVASIEAAAFAGDGVWNGSKITLNADLIGLLAKSIDFGTNTVFEDTKGTIYTTTGGNRIRILGPFGTSNDLVLWYGPTSVALNSETKTNGIFALATDGLVYLGATSLVAPISVTHSGSYVDARVGTGTRNTGSITLSPVGGSGSYTYSHQLVVTDKSASAPTPTLNSPTSATFSVSSGSSTAGNYIEFLVVSTVTDSAGRTAQYIRGGSLRWEA